MKEKQFACVVIGMAIFACFFGIMKMQTKLQDARKRAETAKTTAESTNRQRVVADGNFVDLQKKSRNQIAYYEIWRPLFEEYQSGTDVTEKFQGLMRAHKVSPFSENITRAANQDKHGVITQLQRITLVCVDDYSKLFNWLGRDRIEDAHKPHCLM